MALFDSRFSTGQLVSAANITNASLQSWLRRRFIIGHRDEGEWRRSFTFRNVIEVAIGKAFLDCAALEVEQAFRAAHIFAHTGENGRVPGLPFADTNGVTYIAAAGDHAAVLPAKPYLDVAEAQMQLGGVEGFAVVDANAVFDRVASALQRITGNAAFHPLSILEAAYGEDSGND